MTGRTKTMTGFARLSSCFSAVTMPEDLLEASWIETGSREKKGNVF